MSIYARCTEERKFHGGATKVLWWFEGFIGSYNLIIIKNISLNYYENLCF